MSAAFRLEGSSMLPVFKPGEIVLVSKAVISKAGTRGEPRPFLRPGDCAVYTHECRTLLHRVLKTDPDGAWLADDAGRLEPHFVPLADIRGRALGQHPLSGGLPGLVYSNFRRFWRLNLQRRFNLRS